MHKTTAEVWDPWRLVFLLLITLFCVHKTIGEVWDPETSNSGANHIVFHAQINRRSLGPIVTFNSDPKVAVLHAKTIDEGWHP